MSPVSCIIFIPILVLLIVHSSTAAINDVEDLEALDSKPRLLWRPRDRRSLKELERTIGYSKEDFDELKAKVPRLKKMMGDFYKIKRMTLSCVPTRRRKCVLNQNFQPRDLTFGDISLTVAQVDDLTETFTKLLSSKKRRRKRQMANFSNFQNQKWNGPIKFMINNDYGVNQTWAEQQILGAIAHWEQNTCIRFEHHHVNETEALENDFYIIFTNFFGCYSKLGKTDQPGGQVIGLGIESCFPFQGTAIHEIGHVIGTFHQQNRIDSSTYLNILQDNIQGGAAIQFLPWETPSHITNHNVNFDVGSIMMYGAFHFAIDPTKRTIETNDPLVQYNLGQRNRLSFYDRKLAIKEYCAATCTGPPLSCQRNGIEDPNNCGTCICPDGFGGTLCDTVDSNSHPDCLPLSTTAINVTSSEQCLQTPGYLSGGYTAGNKCNWLLQAPAGRKIKMYFVGNFTLYADVESCWHWVEMKYKGNLDTVGPRFCLSKPGPLISDSNEAAVTFRSDYDQPDLVQQQGFKLCYILEEESNVTTTAPSTTTTTTTTAAPPTCPNKELRCADYKSWDITTTPFTFNGKRKRLLIGPGSACTDRKFKTAQNDTTVFIKLPQFTAFTLHSLCVSSLGATNDTEVKFGFSAGGIPLVYTLDANNCAVLGTPLPTANTLEIEFTRDQAASHLRIFDLFIQACY